MSKKNTGIDAGRRAGRVSTALVLTTSVILSSAVAAHAETTVQVSSDAVAPSEPTSASVTESGADPAQVAGDLNALAAAINALAGSQEPQVQSLVADAPGAGTAGARLSSDGWDYAALATNPTNHQLYAVSVDGDAHPGDRLLRVDARTGAVTDLGPLTATSGADQPSGLTNGTFTNDGTLVLFPPEMDDDARVFTLDLANDASEESAERLMKPRALKVGPAASQAGLDRIGAFAPGPRGSDKKGGLLYSFSGGSDPVLYSYDPSSGTLDATPVAVDEGVAKEDITRQNTVAAWTRDGDTFLAADAEGATVEVAGADGDFTKPVITEVRSLGAAELPPEVSRNLAGGAQFRALVGVLPEVGNRKLTVSVKDADNNPIRGATVSNVNGEEAVTDKLGTVVFDRIPATAYNVLVTAPGFENKYQSVNLAEKDDAIIVTLAEGETLPDQIQGVLNEFTPLLASIAGLAAIVAPAGGTKATTTTRTSAPTTKRAAAAADRAEAETTEQTETSESGTRTVAARTTSRAAEAEGATSTKKSSSRTVKKGDSESTAASSTRSRGGDLADTGTPVRGVAALGLLFLLAGAAYVFMGRRRES